MPPVKQEDVADSSVIPPSSGGTTEPPSVENKNESQPSPYKPGNQIKTPPTKTNILSILQNHGSKNESYKTIGNRIVIPMKVSVATKNLKKDHNSNIITAFPVNKKTTFQMAVPIKKFMTGSPQTVILRDEKRLICKNYGKMQVKSPIFVAKASIKSRSASADTQATESPKNKENNWKDNNLEYGDLNKFMTSVDLLMGQNNDDKESIVSSSDLSKLNSSLVKSKLDNLEEVEDNDLTCLSWLSGNNKELLDTIRMCNPDDPGIGLSEDEVESEDRINKPIFTALSRIQEAGGCHNGQYLSDMEYDPMSKPPYSFSCLIFMAIEDSYLKRLPVKEIYFWVCKHFPYFRTAAPGWKNSIRHNLSLNRCFKKYDSKQNQETVKGSLWCIDPAYRPNLVQALKRSPFYPYLHPTGVGQPLSLNNLANLLPGVHTGRVPSWSPSMPPKQTKPSSTLWADADMASAALNLMGLKGNDATSPKGAENIKTTLDELRTKICNDVDWFDELGSNSKSSVEEVVITGSSEDHIYSLMHKPSKKTSSSIKQEEPPRCLTPDSEKSAPDAAYEFETAGMSESDEDALVVEEDEDIVIADYDSDASDGGHLFDSGFGGMSFNGKEDRKRKLSSASARRKNKPTPNKRRKTDEDAVKSSAKKDARRRSSSKRKSTPLKVRVRKATPKKRQRKLSDVDSGKDSPKAPRIKSRRKANPKKLETPKMNGGHNTRASGHKLLGGNFEERGRRRRKTSYREGDDEDVKLAAGSLLRLAGLISSPAR